VSKYKFKIAYRNENEYGQYWADNRFTVSIIAETLEQAKQKLDEIEKNDYRMHKNILKWEAEEINEEQDKEAEHLKCIISSIKEDYLSEYKEKVDLEERISKAINKIDILLGCEQVKDNLMMKLELEDIKRKLEGEDNGTMD